VHERRHDTATASKNSHNQEDDHMPDTADTEAWLRGLVADDHFALFPDHRDTPPADCGSCTATRPASDEKRLHRLLDALLYNHSFRFPGHRPRRNATCTACRVLARPD
jgi:hypothetical protein